MLKHQMTWQSVRSRITQCLMLAVIGSSVSVWAQQPTQTNWQSTSAAGSLNKGWRPAKSATIAISEQSSQRTRQANYQEYNSGALPMPEFPSAADGTYQGGPALPGVIDPVAGEALPLPNLPGPPESSTAAALPSSVSFSDSGEGGAHGGTPAAPLPQNDLRPVPAAIDEPALSAASINSMPQMTTNNSLPSAARVQADANVLLTSGQRDGRTELRTQRDNSPMQPSMPPPQPARNQVPMRQATTGQPFVSTRFNRNDAGAKSNYPTRPYNPAFYQLAAYQRGGRTTGGAIGTYPPRPVQPTRQQVPRTAAQTPSPGSPGSLAATPTRFTSNASPMPATSLQAAREQNPGFYQTSFNTDQCVQPGFPSTGATGTYVPPTVTPNMAPNVYSANNVGYRPLFTLGQENFNVVMGRGIIGQPTVYVAGQPFRNFFRYLAP